MSSCPVLRRAEVGFMCGYTNKPIDPFSWYCILNYGECPIYIRHTRERRVGEVPRVEEPRVEEPPKPLVEVVSPERLESEFEKAIKPVVDNVVLKYDEAVRKLDNSWRDYESGVINIKRQWEVDKLSLYRARELLYKTVATYERALTELDLRKDFMPADVYQESRRELENRLDHMRSLIEDVESKLGAIEENLGAHFKRVLSTSTTAEVISLKLSLSKLEELLREGKISQQTYERLKKEVEQVLK